LLVGFDISLRSKMDSLRVPSVRDAHTEPHSKAPTGSGALTRSHWGVSPVVVPPSFAAVPDGAKHSLEWSTRLVGRTSSKKLSNTEKVLVGLDLRPRA
jgi:hypothetical protein